MNPLSYTVMMIRAQQRHRQAAAAPAPAAVPAAAAVRAKAVAAKEPAHARTSAASMSTPVAIVKSLVRPRTAAARRGRRMEAVPA